MIRTMTARNQGLIIFGGMVVMWIVSIIVGCIVFGCGIS